MKGYLMRVVTSSACVLLFSVFVREAACGENGPTSIYRYPYMVSVQGATKIPLYNMTSKVLLHMCEGVAVSHRIVLTPAHCLNHDGNQIRINDRRLGVVGGSTYLQYKAKYDYPAIKAKAVSLGPDYSETYKNGRFTNPDDMAADMALITLISPLHTEITEPVALYHGDYKKLDTNCTTAFWGYHLNVMMFYNKYWIRHDMRQQLRASDVTLEACPNSQTGTVCYRRKFQESFANRCGRDAGAPVVCSGYLAGMMIQDNHCRNEPDVYVSLQQHVEWIQNRIDANSAEIYSDNLSGADLAAAPWTPAILLITTSLLFV